MGSSSDPDLVRRQVSQACLVDSRAGVSQRRRCGAADSHPEGEPSAELVVPSCPGVAPVVGQAVERVLLLPRVFDISHVGLSCSCSCDEPACPRSRVKPRIPGIRRRVSHRPWFVPHCLLRVKPRVDGLPVVLEVSGHCPLSRGARRAGERDVQAACGGVVPPPQFMPVSLGVSGRGVCGIAPGWRLAWTHAMSSPLVGCPKWKGAPLLTAR